MRGTLGPMWQEEEPTNMKEKTLFEIKPATSSATFTPVSQVDITIEV